MGTILVIDDETVLLNMFDRMLKRGGYVANSFNSGQKAIDFVNAGGHFDIAIIDKNLRSEDGRIVAHQIRNMLPDIKLIMVSGDPACESSENLFQDDEEPTIDGFLQKPFSRSDLLEIVEKICR